VTAAESLFVGQRVMPLLPVTERLWYGDSRLEIKLPPRGLLLRLLCIGQSYTPGTGAILGRVMSPDGAPAPKLGVQASWASNRNENANVLKEVETRDDGRFAMCGVPLGQDVRLRASTRRTAVDIVVHIRDTATPVLVTLTPRA
jgi:hypothetical protein